MVAVRTVGRHVEVAFVHYELHRVAHSRGTIPHGEWPYRSNRPAPLTVPPLPTRMVLRRNFHELRPRFCDDRGRRRPVRVGANTQSIVAAAAIVPSTSSPRRRRREVDVQDVEPIVFVLVLHARVRPPLLHIGRLAVVPLGHVRMDADRVLQSPTRFCLEGEQVAPDVHPLGALRHRDILYNQYSWSDLHRVHDVLTPATSQPCSKIRHPIRTAPSPHVTRPCPWAALRHLFSSASDRSQLKPMLLQPALRPTASHRCCILLPPCPRSKPSRCSPCPTW